MDDAPVRRRIGNSDLASREVTFQPPEIIEAENGWVIKSYDYVRDEHRYRTAASLDEVRAALEDWMRSVVADVHNIVRRNLQIAAKEDVSGKEDDG